MYQDKYFSNNWCQKESPIVKEDTDSKRPPNAFILYSQEKRSETKQENPTLSNIEISRILGKMWKEVPNDIKMEYKKKAAMLQEEFKREHPDYAYKKARRKKSLNEFLFNHSMAAYEQNQAYLAHINQYGLQPQGTIQIINGLPITPIKTSNSNIQNYPVGSKIYFEQNEQK